MIRGLPGKFLWHSISIPQNKQFPFCGEKRGGERRGEEKRGGESPLSTERRQFVIISISASAAAAAGISAAAFLMPTISRIYMPQSPSFLSQHSNVKSRDFELFHNFFFFFVTTKLFKWIDWEEHFLKYTMRKITNPYLLHFLGG